MDEQSMDSKALAIETEQLVTVQDIGRHAQVARHCGLRSEERRMGVDALDADGNPFEIKTGTKESITTARDVGPHTLDVWRREYWIIAAGRNTAESGFIIDRLYVAHPDQLEPFFTKLEVMFAQNLGVCEEVLAAAEGAGVDPDKIRLIQSIALRGMTKNNPKIPRKLCETLTELDPEDPAKAQSQLHAFVKANPLANRIEPPAQPE